jgi:pimeloyl-ACP methyl ester carboxylesterase
MNQQKRLSVAGLLCLLSLVGPLNAGLSKDVAGGQTAGSPSKLEQEPKAGNNPSTSEFFLQATSQTKLHAAHQAKSQAKQVSTSCSTMMAGSLPVLPRHRIRATPATGEIFQQDRSALNGRKILLFVHGGGAEKRPYFRWQKLVKGLTANPEFNRKFKIYFYRYNTEVPLDTTAPQLKQSILTLRSATGAKQVSLLCLSMGGNLAQRAMLDPAVESAVDLVFCMATPFHGSPLFSPGWFQYSLDSQWYMPWARTVHNLDYLLYFSRHKILQKDLAWDNFDKLIPDVGKFKSGLGIGIGPKGVLTPQADDNPELAAINQSPREDKSKYIAYGGYLVNIYLMHGKRKLLEETVLAPFHYVTVKLPVQLGREHPCLRMLNKEMSSLAVDPQAAKAEHANSHAYVLNDGITPISSSLYLPPEIIKENPMILESELPVLKKVSDIHLVRVFRDLDHISFLDGKPPKHLGRRTLKDQAHPEDGQRKLFAWVAQDLLQYVPEGKSAQLESKTVKPVKID